MQRGEQQLLLALRHKEEVVKQVSADLAALPDKESLIIRKDRTADQETELLRVDNQMLLCKVLVGVAQLSEAVKLQLLVHAQLNHNNNRDRWLQKILEPDLSPLNLVLRVLASLRTPHKADLVEIPLDPRFRTLLSDGRRFQLIGKA